MTKELQQLLADQFLGKDVIVLIPDRDNYGRTIPNRTTDVAGQCTFIGSNPFLNWDIQVTVNGLPVQIKHINDIHLRPQPRRIRQ